MNLGLGLLQHIWPLGRPEERGTDQRPGVRSGSPHQPRSSRDLRIDFLRGLALVTVFIDHVPGNPLNQLTMRNFGFADAAELFVILAGISSMLAYGKCLKRESFTAGSRRIAQRCLRIYICQILLLVGTLALVQEWRMHFGLKPVQLAPFFERPFAAFGQALLLHAQPASLNILPLYIVLLALFPLINFGLCHSTRLTLAVSASVWLATNIDNGFNFTNWLDGQAWFFNPFAWQFLFTLGAFGAVMLHRYGGDLPRVSLIAFVSWAYLLGAFFVAAPWSNWGLSDVRLFDFDAPDKTDLSPARLTNILAFIYLALSSANLQRFAARAWANPIVACGKHSLEIFTFGTLLALVFRLLFRTFGSSWWLEVLVNLVGIGALLGLALLLERRRAALRQRERQPQSFHAVASAIAGH
jgi:hypothetical protein